MEANKKKNAKKENIWNDSDETQIVYKYFNKQSKSLRLVYICTQAQIHS